MTFNYLSLFSGIGGLDLGLDRAGMTCVGQVEREPYCQRVLAKHWPEVPKHDDVRTAPGWWLGADRPAVDAVVGGFPCQPASDAGRRQGEADPRWLWPAMAAVIEALRPAWVVGENVPGLRTRGLGTVLADLTQLGYRTRPGLVSACAVGAPHARSRLFVLAHADGIRCGRRIGSLGDLGPQPTHRAGWLAEPDVGRVAHGVPARVDRLRGLGNAVVPQVAEHVGRLILDHAAAGVR